MGENNWLSSPLCSLSLSLLQASDYLNLLFLPLQEQGTFYIVKLLFVLLIQNWEKAYSKEMGLS